MLLEFDVSTRKELPAPSRQEISWQSIASPSNLYHIFKIIKNYQKWKSPPSHISHHRYTHTPTHVTHTHHTYTHIRTHTSHCVSTFKKDVIPFQSEKNKIFLFVLFYLKLEWVFSIQLSEINRLCWFIKEFSSKSIFFFC